MLQSPRARPFPSSLRLIQKLGTSPIPFVRGINDNVFKQWNVIQK